MFGTDGIRGKVNVYPMTAELALRFGMAAGVYLKGDSQDSDIRPTVIIAKDTRLSGYLLESSLTAGLVSLGIDVVLIGPLPTPAVPKLVRSLRAAFGIMITASHNPYHDNGFKLFNKKGQKLTEECERNICDLILQNDFEPEFCSPNRLGKVTRLDDAPGRYIEHVKSALSRKLSLQGLRIVIDCANGAAYKVGPSVLWELGAEVIVIHNKPDGVNINDSCGSIHPTSLASKVLDTRADLGIALDGDADRLVICDEEGQIVDGDHVLAAIACYLHSKSGGKEQGIVITEASNSALKEYMESMGTKVTVTKVGDRNVDHGMRRTASSLGGEKSGHIIVHDHGFVSDGLVAALYILSYLVARGQKASDISRLFNLYPQFNANVHYYGDNPLENEEIRKQIEAISLKKHSKDRILVRKSGTERDYGKL